ncbi:MAG: DUF4271 domain-containing protein [Crocinitomicaceae bacterium]|nr:DUF4271 domain-containing protein [Crocinitomicaceae bacterium]
MTLLAKISNIISVIPSELTLRDQSITITVGFGLFLSFLLISFAKLIKSDVYSSMIVSLTKINGLRAFTKETYPVNKVDSLILILNYLFSASTILLILFNTDELVVDNKLQYAILIPFLLLIWSVLSMFFVLIITGERQVFIEPFIMKVVGAQLLGLFYFLLSLVFTLNSFDHKLLMEIIIWSFLIESVVRLFKSISVVYLKGVSWYYIILYFCTLEILPLVVAYYYVLGNFEK